MAPITDPGLDATTHRKVAVALFNRTWSLLDLPSRTADQDDELVHTTHASAYHWMQVGAAENRARSEWQCARVYSVLGRAEPSLWHARRCLAICEQEGIGDWDLGFAYEAVARAHAVAGDVEESTRWLDRARTAAAEVASAEDRDLLLADLEAVAGLL